MRIYSKRGERHAVCESVVGTIVVMVAVAVLVTNFVDGAPTNVAVDVVVAN